MSRLRASSRHDQRVAHHDRTRKAVIEDPVRSTGELTATTLIRWAAMHHGAYLRPSGLMGKFPNLTVPADEP